MATRFLFRHDRIRLFAGVGLAAMALALAAGCGAEDGPTLVFERSVGAEARVPYIIDVIRETGAGGYDRYKFIDVGAWDDSGLQDIPAVAESFAGKNVPDLMREIGRYDEVVAPVIKDVVVVVAPATAPAAVADILRHYPMPGDPHDAVASFNDLMGEAATIALSSIVTMPGDDHDAAAQLTEWYASLQPETPSRIRESD